MPFKAFSFPAEYNDVTITNANLDFDLELIYSTENLNADPVLVRSKFDRTSTMVGSGNVVLPFNGGKSKAYDFLIEKREQTRVDSFYLFGQPAPACLPNFFGTSQGNVIASGDRYLFWVENAEQPLLIINNDLNNNIIFASYLRSHIDTAEVSIAATNYTLNKNFNVFPNPVQDQLFIELKDDAVATISLTDMMS